PPLPTFLSPPRCPPGPTLFPYPTLFRSDLGRVRRRGTDRAVQAGERLRRQGLGPVQDLRGPRVGAARLALLLVGERQRPQREDRSEEHTSELQSRENLVCRLLLEKKKNN